MPIVSATENDNIDLPEDENDAARLDAAEEGAEDADLADEATNLPAVPPIPPKAKAAARRKAAQGSKRIAASSETTDAYDTVVLRVPNTDVDVEVPNLASGLSWQHMRRIATMNDLAACFYLAEVLFDDEVQDFLEKHLRRPEHVNEFFDRWFKRSKVSLGELRASRRS